MSRIPPTQSQPLPMPPRPPRQPWRQCVRRFAAGAPVTVIIAIACVAVWLVCLVQAGSLMGDYYDSALANSWTLWGPMVAAGQWWQVPGSMFVHVNGAHLAVNLLFLLLVGREVERWLGSALFAACYAVAGLGGAAGVVWLAFEQPTVGASGALYGIMALLLGAQRARGLDLRPTLFLIGANVLYTVSDPSVSLWGHVGGLITGMCLLVFVRSRRAWVRWTGVVLCGAAAVLVLAAIAVV
ncbi:rhomboid family intramembrane serine protease [Corynebacterium lizhenjunii]|uniref:Rhomboid family intramembrane serine protease n=1 Tax=Corynebacterium lizhenjunii TaxID=2709394 RepID=A0A7T0P9W3_9CORY|nr:rhomboid family intramembrane serine protease [Corynebacterium lizhenjunii]QPK79198.1 rhomboid family intramembrane serine protease [Corynebacterium lizhenjunii]